MVLENNIIEELKEENIPFIVLTYYISASIENEKRKKVNEIAYIIDKQIIRRLEKGLDMYDYEKHKVLSTQDGIIHEFNDFKNEFNKLTIDIKNIYLNNRKFLESLHSANHF